MKKTRRSIVATLLVIALTLNNLNETHANASPPSSTPSGIRLPASFEPTPTPSTTSTSPSTYPSISLSEEISKSPFLLTPLDSLDVIPLIEQTFPSKSLQQPLSISPSSYPRPIDPSDAPSKRSSPFLRQSDSSSRNNSDGIMGGGSIVGRIIGFILLFVLVALFVGSLGQSIRRKMKRRRRRRRRRANKSEVDDNYDPFKNDEHLIYLDI